MKTKALKIIITVILAVTYLFESPLNSLVVTVIACFSSYNNTVMEIIPYAAIFVCLLIALKPFMNVINFLKIFILFLPFVLIDDIFSSLLEGNLPVMIYLILRPIVIIAFILLIFRVVSKIRLRLNKQHLILMFCTFVAGAVSCICEYIAIIINSTKNGNDSLYYWYALDVPGNEIVAACYYVCILLILYRFIEYLPDLIKAKIIADENAKEDEDDMLMTEVAEGFWQCVACGELVSTDENICECGYEREG